MADARSRKVAHARRMSATPVRQQRYPLGVALFGRLLACGLVLVAIAIGTVWLFVARNAAPAFVVGAVGALLGAVGGSTVAGAGLFHQARPSPRPPLGEALVWRPTLATMAGAVVAGTGLGMAGLAVGTFGLRTPGPLSAGLGPLLVWLVATFGPLFMWFVSSRIPIARLEADSWGIRCTTPLTTVRVPWSDLRSLEVRGGSGSTQRVVAVTKQGRERILRVWDPRLPVTRNVARDLVADLKAVRRSATTPDPVGID